eukprot:2698915-Prymnesium_polylepis.1
MGMVRSLLADATAPGGALNGGGDGGGSLVKRTMDVPRDAVTLVIGAQGSTIKRIRAASGARVNTDRTAGDQQPITFEGTEAQ